jgi:uncharacterized protein (DUF1778 family)/GNAT superfamily N-acetyltransferase
MTETSILSVQVSPNEGAILKAAAEQSRTTLSDFIRCKAVEAAEINMFYRGLIAIPADDWEAFDAWINRPAEENPALAELALRAPSSGAPDTTAMTPPRPLAENDDRAFDCGRESFNNWFRLHAWFNQVNNMTRVNVIADAATGRIVGYVTLSAAQIEPALRPETQPFDRPDPVPALLLGQLAVDKDYQRQGHAADLLRFALKAALRATDSVGGMGVITHPLDDDLRRFYARWGFQDVPFDPHRAMIARMTEVKRYLGTN